MVNQKRGFWRLFFIILFGAYIIELINLLFFPFYKPDNWTTYLTWNHTRGILNEVNLSPLYFLSISTHPFSMHWLYLDIFQNILLTIPLGFGIGYFRKPGFLKIWLWALGTGIALEGIQLLTKLVFVSYRVVDINDAIMNALGVLIGYGLFLFCRKFFTRMEKSKSILKP